MARKPRKRITVEGPTEPVRRRGRPRKVEEAAVGPVVVVPPVVTTPNVPTFRKLAELVLADRKLTVRGYNRELSRYRCHIATAAFIDMLVPDIESTHIRDWLRWMRLRPAQVHEGEEPRTVSQATSNRCQSLVSVILGEGVERGFRKDNPCIGVKLKRVADERDTREKRTSLTIEEQRKLLACDAIPLADRLAAAFAIHTGVRQSEQFNLELSDLHVDDPKPHFIVRYSRRHLGRKAPPKSGKARRVPLTQEALIVTRQWLEMLPAFAPNNPENLVFPSVRGCIRQQGKPLAEAARTMRSVFEAAGIPYRKGLCWHALRHTCATNLVTGVLGRAWRLEEIQKVLGHSSVQVTEIYSHMTEDAIAAAAAETRLVPVDPPLDQAEQGIVLAASLAAETVAPAPDAANVTWLSALWFALCNFRLLLRRNRSAELSDAELLARCERLGLTLNLQIEARASGDPDAWNVAADAWEERGDHSLARQCRTMAARTST